MADIRVLIVDDIERVRQDLRTFLFLAGGIEVVGEAENGQKAVQLVKILCPQVILLDLEMPLMDGYEAAHQIKLLHPACRVLVLTIHGSRAEQERAFRAGADDFFVKGAPLETLVEAIRRAPAFGQTPTGD